MLSNAFITLARRHRRVCELLALLEQQPCSTVQLAKRTDRSVREVAGVMGWLRVLGLVEPRKHVVVYGPRGGHESTATCWHRTARCMPDTNTSLEAAGQQTVLPLEPVVPAAAGEVGALLAGPEHGATRP